MYYIYLETYLFLKCHFQKNTDSILRNLNKKTTQVKFHCNVSDTPFIKSTTVRLITGTEVIPSEEQRKALPLHSLVNFAFPTKGSSFFY